MAIYFDAPKEAGGFLPLILCLAFAGIVAALILAMRAASMDRVRALRTQ